MHRLIYTLYVNNWRIAHVLVDSYNREKVAAVRQNASQRRG